MNTPSPLTERGRVRVAQKLPLIPLLRGADRRKTFVGRIFRNDIAKIHPCGEVRVDKRNIKIARISWCDQFRTIT